MPQYFMLILVFLLVSYAITRYVSGLGTAANGLPILLVCLGVAVAFVALLRSLPAEWGGYAWSAFSLIFSIFVAASVLIRLRGVARSGDNLLEIGRPRGGLLIGTASIAACLLAGIASIAPAVGGGEAGAAGRVEHLATGILWLSMTPIMLTFWMSKSSIRQRGIVTFGRLIGWERVQGFRWSEHRPSTLALRVKRRFRSPCTIHLPIPSDKREAVSEILQRSPFARG